MKSAVDWTMRKAIVFESDDWGGMTRTSAPNADACRKAEPLWAETGGKFDTWRKGTLETVTHMQRLFDVLRSFRGGDGRPVVLCPMVLLGNPDFGAIDANRFTEYVDIGLDEGFPEPWQGEGSVEKAREGMRLGVWYPEYHGRAHHFSPQRWVDILRKGEDETLRGFFDLRMFGISNCGVGLEFDGMDEEAQQAWIRVGFERFERCFGRRPVCAINGDATAETERVWRGMGIKARLGSRRRNMGEVDPETGLMHFVRNVLLEAQGVPDAQTPNGCTGAYAGTQAAWSANQPALISIHRKNFTSLDDEEDATSWAQFEQFLHSVQTEHPEAVYLCNDEVMQLWTDGTSCVRYGDELVCRNWTGARRELVGGVPDGKTVAEVVDVAREKTIPFETGEAGTIRFGCEDGTYSVVLRVED